MKMIAGISASNNFISMSKMCREYNICGLSYIYSFVMGTSENQA